MGKRAAASKATRGASKGKRPISSSSSNPKTTKFRSQYNSLAVIAKGGPSKKAQNKDALKRATKDALERNALLDGLNNIDFDAAKEGKVTKKSKETRKFVREDDDISNFSGDTKRTTASFASVWSNCTNASLNEFFQVWNPNLETHKDALAVIAGLSQLMSAEGKEQSDSEYTQTLFKIISSTDTPSNILTGALLALTFVMRKLPDSIIIESFDSYYAALKTLMENYHTSRKKSLIKCIIRCFATLSKAHPLGKKAIESSLRKKINLAIRQFKVQDKIRL